MPFFARVSFAFICWFRVLFDGAFARRVHALADGRATALPAPVEPDSSLAAPAPAGPGAEEGALELLALLQREGRFVDFVQQDVAAFSDADIGAAARVVHDGCRRALGAHLVVEPVRAEDEGSRVTLEAGFDADAVKLTGNVGGHAPFSGTLRHRGWRASRVTLPDLVGSHDRRVLAPAEVEL
jgi:hypothetical protein